MFSPFFSFLQYFPLSDIPSPFYFLSSDWVLPSCQVAFSCLRLPECWEDRCAPPRVAQMSSRDTVRNCPPQAAPLSCLCLPHACCWVRGSQCFLGGTRPGEVSPEVSPARWGPLALPRLPLGTALAQPSCSLFPSGSALRVHENPSPRFRPTPF